MRVASLNPIAAIARSVAGHASVLLHDAMRGLGTAIHASEGRLVAYLRGVENRITTAAEHREERIMARLDALDAAVADFRARHGFVGDPVAQSPAVSEAGERMVPRRPQIGRGGLPPGRPHP